MSLGTVFTLLANDGETDLLLTNIKFLYKKLNDIKVNRIKKCILKYEEFFKTANKNDYSEIEKKAFYKNPFSFCESKKLKANQLTLHDITKSHNVFLYKSYKPYVPISSVYLKNSQASGKAEFGNTIKFTLDKKSSWIADQFLHIKIDGLRSISASDKVKYCAFLGHRIIESIKVRFADVDLDEVTTEDYNEEYNQTVKKSKWMQCMGQEIPNIAYLTSDPINHNFREIKWILDGPQTLKDSHGELNLFIPFIFWYNKIEEAFPHCMVPWGHFDITVKLRNVSELVASVDNGGGGAFENPEIKSIELYTNHLESIPQFVQIYKNNFVFKIARVHRHAQYTLNKDQDNIKIDKIKYAIEELYVDVRPNENLNSVDNWYRSVKLTKQTAKFAIITDSPNPNTLGINTASYDKESPMVDTISLHHKTIDLYPEMPHGFYEYYLPLIRGNYFYTLIPWNGRYLFTFVNKKKEYNPSGHFNASRNRDLYIKYTSSQIDYNNNAIMYVNAKTINFLYIEDEVGVTMRYIT